MGAVARKGWAPYRREPDSFACIACIHDTDTTARGWLPGARLVYEARAKRTLRIPYTAVYTVIQCTALYSVYCTVYSILYTVLYSIQYTVHCTVYCTVYTTGWLAGWLAGWLIPIESHRIQGNHKKTLILVISSKFY